jgi:hypothetical protein
VGLQIGVPALQLIDRPNEHQNRPDRFVRAHDQLEIGGVG